MKSVHVLFFLYLCGDLLTLLISISYVRVQKVSSD